MGNRYDEAHTLTRLGDVLHAAGDRSAACETWREASDILVDLGHPDAEAVRARLTP